MDDSIHIIQLTQTELAVLEYLSEDFSIEQTADMLGISPNTCKRHRESILRKTKKHTLLAAYKECLRRGVILLPSIPI